MTAKKPSRRNIGRGEMKAKILAYPCKGWCVGKTGEAEMFVHPERGILVHFDAVCPHKKNSPPCGTQCFFESNQVMIEILEGFT